MATPKHRHAAEVRVRYQETDQAGVVYHANYFAYFEVGRTELLRSLGSSYREFEEREGMVLTVVEASARYHRPARYDDVLRIETRVEETSGARLRFGYEIFHRDGGELLCSGSTLLAAVDRASGKPGRLPDEIRRALEVFVGR